MDHPFYTQNDLISLHMLFRIGCKISRQLEVDELHDYSISRYIFSDTRRNRKLKEIYKTSPRRILSYYRPRQSIYFHEKQHKTETRTY